MMITRAAQMAVFASLAALAIQPAGAPADVPGRSEAPGINRSVGGVRAAFPGPPAGLGRRGSLLDRTGSLLPSGPGTTPRASTGTSGSGPGFPSFPFPNGGPNGGGTVPTGASPNDWNGTVDGFTPVTPADRFWFRLHLLQNESRRGGWGGHGGGWGGGHHGLFWRYPGLGWNGWGLGGYGWGGYGYGSYGNGYDQPFIAYGGPWYGTDPFVTTGQPGTYQTSPASARRGQGGGGGGGGGGSPELSPVEKAEIFWRAGRPGQAVLELKDYLGAAPDDTEAMRFLALALIDDRKPDEGVAMMAMAYARTPQLGSRPLPMMDIPGGEKRMRERVNTLSGYANRVKTGSAWLTLAAMIQSEGREPVARTIIDRARRAGLDEQVAKEMMAGMGG